MNVIQVLRSVSLEIPDGQIIALLGANGAGKTTVLKAISGMLKTEEGEVTEGSIVYDGIRIDKYGPERIASMRISQAMEGRRVLEHLTVEENLMVGAYTRNDKGIKKDLELVFSYFPKLKDLRRHVSGYLSGGEQQMLVIARAMMANPKLMLLDEPSLGLAPLMVQEIYKVIKRIGSEQKMSILIVEQNARAALNVADFAYVMENGRVVLYGPAKELIDNEDIKEFYMGKTSDSHKNYREIKHYHRKKKWLS
jgi:branched-chain amino acid transport system ATP-binding protein